MNDVKTSPRDSANDDTGFIKNGTSEPRFNANLPTVSASNSKLNNLAKAKIVDAALELPPPSPAPIGICLSKNTFTGS